MQPTLKMGAKKLANKHKQQDPHWDDLQKLHDRLRSLLSLGIRFHKENKIWWNSSAEVQGQFVRAVSAFVSKLKTSDCKQPPIQAILKEIIIALEGLLQSESDEICNNSATITVKLTVLFGVPLLKTGIERLVGPLASLLSSKRSAIATSCAVALNFIIKHQKSKCAFDCRCGYDGCCLKIFETTQALNSVVNGLKGYENSIFQSEEYYVEFANLLATILKSFPSLRYQIGSERILRINLFSMTKSDNAAVTLSALQASFALALCREVALKQMDDEEMLWLTISHCLDISKPTNTRVESLRFLQFIARSAYGFSKISTLHLCRFVESIMQILIECKKFVHEKQTPDLETLSVEASRTANAFLKWPGEHHSYFWKRDVRSIVAKLLLTNADARLRLQLRTESISNSINLNRRPLLRANLWDMLGWLSIHCVSDQFSVNESPSFQRLLLFACKLAVGIVHKRSQLHVQPGFGNFVTHDVSDASEREPICRAVLFLVNSPCKAIATETVAFLLECLEPFSDGWLESLLKTVSLGSYSIGDSAFDSLLMVVATMSLATFSSLKKYQPVLQTYNSLEILSRAIIACSDQSISVARTNVSKHTCSQPDYRACCWNDMQDWEGNNLILFFTLWTLSKLLHRSEFSSDVRQLISYEERSTNFGPKELELKTFVMQLQKIVSDRRYSLGVQWYAACSLACFGLYAFSSKLGEKIKEAYGSASFADLLLRLPDGSSINAHLAILATRCPSLLPSSVLTSGSKTNNLLENVLHEVRFSSKINDSALQKVIEFVYTGTIQIDEEYEVDLKILTKRCKIEPLFSLLDGRAPIWGTSFPYYSLMSALDFGGHKFSDIILQPQGVTQSTTGCSSCTLKTDHVHAHRIILSSSCDYFQGLFRSEMSDSSAEILQLPISWDALRKLVSYLYTGEINSLCSVCFWKSMNIDQQIKDLQACIELSWIGQQWLLQDIQDLSFSVILQKLSWNCHLCPRIIQMAAEYSQWDIVEAAAQCVAPLYSDMRLELEELDDQLMDIVRIAHVHHISGTYRH